MAKDQYRLSEKTALLLLRVVALLLFAAAFLLSALAGNVFNTPGNVFWVFAIPAIAVGALAGYFSDKVTKNEIAAIEKRFEKKIQNLQSQIEALKTDKINQPQDYS